MTLLTARPKQVWQTLGQGGADLVLEDSLYAIAATHVVDGSHCTFVNLVTPGELGDPVAYLVPALRERLGDSIRLEEIGECGCGGFVVRIWRLR